MTIGWSYRPSWSTRHPEITCDLAAHPEKREPPLSWGLQFIVRGDVLLEDGSVQTLDELADAADVPRLPLLKDMPDEIETDVD